MFAALSVKTTLFSVLLISLASISIAQEDKPIKFTLSVQKVIHHPQADIEFERTDNNIKWFNDNSLSIDSDLIYGLNIPLNQINLNYKNILCEAYIVVKRYKKLVFLPLALGK